MNVGIDLMSDEFFDIVGIEVKPKINCDMAKELGECPTGKNELRNKHIRISRALWNDKFDTVILILKCGVCGMNISRYVPQRDYDTKNYVRNNFGLVIEHG